MYKASTLTKKVKKQYTCPKPFKMILLINVIKKEKNSNCTKKKI